MSLVVSLAPVLHSFLHPHTCYGFLIDGVSFLVEDGHGHMTFFVNGMLVDEYKQGLEKCLHTGVYPLLPVPLTSEEQASASLLSKEDPMKGMWSRAPKAVQT